MASIEKGGPRAAGGEPSGAGRGRDPSGQQRSRNFKTSRDAKTFQATVEADKARGTYVDHSLGRVTLGEYAAGWLESQTVEATTREQMTHRLKKHILPALGGTPLAAIKPSQLQSWVRTLDRGLSARTVAQVFAQLSAILEAAVDDERIGKNPCRASSIRLPRPEKRKVEPWRDEQVVALRESLPGQYGVLLLLTTGLGLRQGEVFGLAVEDIDFLRGVVKVQRQVRLVDSKLVFSLPKNRKVREVPLPSRVGHALAAHLQQFPPRRVELPWQTPDGRPVAAALVVTSREGRALNRNYVNRHVWGPALTRAGIDRSRAQGMHAGRHFYASVQLEAGTSIRALAEYLGHSDPGFTLRTYTHLMPQAEDKAKRAVDDVFDRLENVSNGPLRVPDVSRESL